MSENMKVYEFAKELNIETIALMDRIKQWKIPVKSHMASLTPELMEDIQTKFAAEVEVKTATKKVTKKKKVAKKKAVAKKVTKKKTVVSKTVTKKTVTKKKAVATKSTTKKTVSKKASSKKADAPAKKVIRRKAGIAPTPPPPVEIPAEASDELAAAIMAAEGIAAEETPNITIASATGTTTTIKRTNIVGKIDLKKVAEARARRVQASRPGQTTPRSTTTGRNIRAGFVPDVAPKIEDTAYSRKEAAAAKELENKKKKASAKEKGEEQKSFVQADYRKREVIFQPKRKKTFDKTNAKKTQITIPKASKRIVEIHETIAVVDLAAQMNLKVPQLTKVLIANGIMANMNTVIDFDTVSLIVPEFQFEAVNVQRTTDDLFKEAEFGELDAELVSRPPVVTVMGHVDHGKTTLLDTIRKANVVTGEAGGITQHIGAYSVLTDKGNEVTFIDTPGHAAFTEMRARGANVTDIAIIVVAADDGMMPQTQEAINHAKTAGVHIIIAVNKIDKPEANADKIKQQLTEMELVPEDWGGDTIYCDVSALKGTGIENLLEQISVVSELSELKANPKKSGSGIVIESSMIKGRGTVATLLVQDGTVKVGQSISAGLVSGKVRAMTNDKGKRVKEVGPGRPVEVTGFDNPPSAGDQFVICKTDDQAREIAEFRKISLDKEAVPSSEMSLDDIFAKAIKKDLEELPVLIKTDVAGSLEAIKSSLAKLDTEEVKVKVIHSGVGAVTESDVLLAKTVNAMVIGFNVRPDSLASKMALEKSLTINCYKIIYELIDDVKKSMGGLLKPDLVEKELGKAEVRDTFSVPKIGVIGGCMVLEGKVLRKASVRLVRDGRVIYEGVMNSLKRFKDDAKEVASGYECGIGIENYNDLKVGDVIEAFEVNEIAREL